jgi:hypothetical protein
MPKTIAVMQTDCSSRSSGVADPVCRASHIRFTYASGAIAMVRCCASFIEPDAALE